MIPQAQYKEAATLYREAAEAFAATYGPGHAKTWKTWLCLADMYAKHQPLLLQAAVQIYADVLALPPQNMPEARRVAVETQLAELRRGLATWAPTTASRPDSNAGAAMAQGEGMGPVAGPDSGQGEADASGTSETRWSRFGRAVWGALQSEIAVAQWVEDVRPLLEGLGVPHELQTALCNRMVHEGLLPSRAERI